MELAANISMLYAGLPENERFAAAAADGFRHVEILRPYDASPDWYASQLEAHGLRLVLINTPSAHPDHPMGLAAQPDAQAAFRAAMDQAAEVCRQTACPAVHVLAGTISPSYSRQAQEKTLYDNLHWAARRYPELRLQLEALNSHDVPGYLYSRPHDVARILAEIDAPNVRMQFDFYHVVKEGLAPADELRRYFPLVAHVQVAGAPDRHEPDVSKDGVLAGFEALHAADYSGYVGLEYRPARTAAEGLHWLQPLTERGWLHKG